MCGGDGGGWGGWVKRHSLHSQQINHKALRMSQTAMCGRRGQCDVCVSPAFPGACHCFWVCAQVLLHMDQVSGLHCSQLDMIVVGCHRGSPVHGNQVQVRGEGVVWFWGVCGRSAENAKHSRHPHLVSKTHLCPYCFSTRLLTKLGP